MTRRIRNPKIEQAKVFFAMTVKCIKDVEKEVDYPNLHLKFAMAVRGGVERYRQLEWSKPDGLPNEVTNAIEGAIAAIKSGQARTRVAENFGFGNTKNLRACMNSYASALKFKEIKVAEEKAAQRLEIVKTHLLDASIPLSRIVRDVGYADKEALISSFQGAYGVDPLTWRERHSPERVEIKKIKSIQNFLRETVQSPASFAGAHGFKTKDQMDSFLLEKIGVPSQKYRAQQWKKNGVPDSFSRAREDAEEKAASTGSYERYPSGRTLAEIAEQTWFGDADNLHQCFGIAGIKIEPDTRTGLAVGDDVRYEGA